MFKILIAEDDRHTRKLMEVILSENGYEVLSAANGLEAVDLFSMQKVDLVILDVMMPKMDGFEVARYIRDTDPDTPILMVTARGELEDKKEGFLAGTDDYMVKPVDEEEMMLRIHALLRRFKTVTERKLTIGKVTLDYDALTVSWENETQTLPQKEFYLLYKLLSNPNKIFTRLQLMDEIWGMDTETTDNTVNVHINRLRNRFENIEDFEIQTIRGLGYKGVHKA